MQGSYNLWLVALSLVVAIAVAYSALRLAGRVAEDRSGARLWLLGGAISMGIGIWSMHFIGMLAFSVPIPLRYNILTTLVSLIIAMLTSGFALAVASHRNLNFTRLVIGALFMGAGISAMHYTGMAAIQIMPVISYDPLLVAASIGIAIVASFAALWLFFRLRSGQSWLMHFARAAAAIVMGFAITGMHYTAMAASMLDPRSYCLGGAAFDNSWLAVTIGLIALAVVAITLITTVYDAHLESHTRQEALHLAQLNADLQHGKNLLTLATQAAGIAYWEYDVTTGETVWTENEIAALRTEGIDLRAPAQTLLAMVDPQDAAAAQAALHAALAEGRQVCAARVRIACPSGVTVHLQAHARLQRDPRGGLGRLLGVCWDVSANVRQEERRAALQLQLRDASRQAGMAEVATGVLHNVGNVLNSVNVSANLLVEYVGNSRGDDLARVAALLREHERDLGSFVTTHPQGKHLTAYLESLEQHLAAERQAATRELDTLLEKVGHIRDIVMMQQNYAMVVGVHEELNVTDLVEESLRLSAAALTRHQIEIVRAYEDVPVINVDRHKVLQILVNLLSNAKYACVETGQADRRVTMRVAGAENRVQISVTDNGIGIAPENLTRIFGHGFTTRKTGHGFGLHSGALAARELGGSLSAHSDGTGRGATLTLELPLQVTRPVEQEVAYA